MRSKVGGDAVVLTNFRGDRAIEITRAFDDALFVKFDRVRRPDVLFAGMMEYDGDLHLLLAGVPGLAERGWEGRRLRIGKAGQPDAVVVALADLRGRCIMTTFDPDTLEQEPRVLRTVVERTGGVLGLNAEVVRGGRVRVGDPVELLRG